MQRFFLNQKIDSDYIAVEDRSLYHQLAKVLRADAGTQVILLDNSGYEYETELTSLQKGKLIFHIREKKKNQNEPDRRIILYQALPKKISIFEFVLQKGTELGVSEFVPLITKRTERRLINRKERLLKILKEAAEQSGRGKIPRLNKPMELRQALENSMKPKIEKCAILFDLRGEPFGAIREHIKSKKEIHCFVGPEGGFTEEEINSAKKSGAFVVSIGPRTLRTETAGIIAPAILLI